MDDDDQFDPRPLFLPERTCKHGHTGWSRRIWQHDSRSGNDYLVIVCDECARVSSRKKDQKERESGIRRLSKIPKSRRKP